MLQTCCRSLTRYSTSTDPCRVKSRYLVWIKRRFSCLVYSHPPDAPWQLQLTDSDDCSDDERVRRVYVHTVCMVYAEYQYWFKSASSLFLSRNRFLGCGTELAMLYTFLSCERRENASIWSWSTLINELWYSYLRQNQRKKACSWPRVYSILRFPTSDVFSDVSMNEMSYAMDDKCGLSINQ